MASWWLSKTVTKWKHACTDDFTGQSHNQHLTSHVNFWWMIGSRWWLTCHLGTIYPSYVRQATWTDTFEYDKSSCFIPVNHWLLLITISLKPFLFTHTISKGFFPWPTSVKLERVTWRIMMVFCLCRAGVGMACTWRIWPAGHQYDTPALTYLLLHGLLEAANSSH